MRKTNISYKIEKLLQVSIVLLLSILITTTLLNNSTDKPDTGPVIIKLNSSNTVCLCDSITKKSTSKLIQDMLLLDRSLRLGSPLFLVINSTGGEYLEGLKVISAAKSLSREVQTITVSASSMAFIIVQSLGARNIIRQAKMMTHRIYTTFSKPVTINYPFIPGSYNEQLLDSAMDTYNTVASRMHITLDEYLKMISQDYYLYGNSILKYNAADRYVSIECSPELISNNICPLTM